MAIYRITVLWFLIFGVCFAATARAADQVGVGVVAGVNISGVNLKGSDAINISSSSKAGVYVGAFAILPVTSMIAIQPEVAFSSKHFSVKDTVGSFAAEEKWNWVEVPVLARITVWHSAQHQLFVLAGPGFAFRAGAKESFGSTESDVKNSVKSTDIGLIGGLGFEMGHVGIEARYDAGLKDLNKDNGLGDLLKVKNRAFRIDATWRIR